MNSRENLPMMLSANDIQTMGFTRTMAYNILNREDVPVVKIGSRKFIQRDKFFDWLDRREKNEIVNSDGRTDKRRRRNCRRNLLRTNRRPLHKVGR